MPDAMSEPQAPGTTPHSLWLLIQQLQDDRW
jgi:hypothetical protein